MPLWLTYKVFVSASKKLCQSSFKMFIGLNVFQFFKQGLSNDSHISRCRRYTDCGLSKVEKLPICGCNVSPQNRMLCGKKMQLKSLENFPLDDNLRPLKWVSFCALKSVDLSTVSFVESTQTTKGILP